MKKIVIASSIIGAIAIVAAVVIRRKRKKLEDDILAGSPDIVGVAKQSTASVVFPLKKGSGVTTAEKNAVKVVQRYINARSSRSWYLGVPIISEDGLFGPLTEASLQKLTAVKEVSYSLYKQMQDYLTPVPNMLSPNVAPYSTDPAVQKNNLSASASALTLFG